MSTIFLSYSHRSEQREHSHRWKSRLLDQLRVLTAHGLIAAWDDERIPGGWRWAREIDRAIHTAAVAIVMLTPELLESEFILDHELPAIRQRSDEGGLLAYPILCEPCAWQSHPWLQTVQIRPFEATPLSQLSEHERDRWLRTIVAEIADRLSSVAIEALSRPPSGADAAPTAPASVRLAELTLGRARDESRRLIGREQELAMLDLVFAERRVGVLSLVAWGGTGKTMLVQTWLRRLERVQWLDLTAVYGWSFHGDGAADDRRGSEDFFLARALEWFDIRCPPATPAWKKGQLIAAAMRARRTLLILDGLESVQHPPGAQGGQLRGSGLQHLLNGLGVVGDAQAPSLCIVTTREAVMSLDVPLIQLQLGELTDHAGAAVLHAAGATLAGSAEIPPDDSELLEASRELNGHALTLYLLGRFLHRAHGGDIRQRDRVAFEHADATVEGGVTFRMLAAFEKWFAAGGEFGRRRLCVLRLLGLFDRPAALAALAETRRPPVLRGLTDALFLPVGDWVGHAESDVPTAIEDQDFNEVISFLCDFGLVTIIHRTTEASDEGRELDCHPLTREYFSRQVHLRYPESSEAAHQRLFRHFSGVLLLVDAQV